MGDPLPPADPSSRGRAVERAWAPVLPHMPPTDGEKLSGVTEGRGVRAALSTQRAEDSSESREEEQAVSRAVGKNTCVQHTHLGAVASEPVGCVDGRLRGLVGACSHTKHHPDTDSPDWSPGLGGRSGARVGGPVSAWSSSSNEGHLDVWSGYDGFGIFAWMCAGESLRGLCPTACGCGIPPVSQL